MRGVIEGLTAPMGHRHLAENLITEALLAVLRYLYLLLQRAHELFVWWHFFPRNWVGQFSMVQVRLDIVQIVVDERRRLLLEGDKKGFLHVVAGNLIVLPTSLSDQLAVAFAVRLVELAVALDPVFESTQHIDGIDAARVRLDQGGRDAIDNEAWRHAVHALALRLLLNEFQVLLTEAFDIFPIVEFEFLEECEAGYFGLFQPRQDGEDSRHTQRVRR